MILDYPLGAVPKIDGNSGERVLVAEDNAMFRKILHSWLEGWGYEVTLADAGERAWSILECDRPPQMVILDWMMPEIDGVELCRRIRARNRPPYQYVLLVTSKDEQSDRVSGLEAGADDYLTKPFDRNELRARLRVGRRILALQEDLIQAREGLRYQATHDMLTGSLNRGAILEALQRELDRAKRSASPIGLLLLDLDRFKRVNDRYGHLAGDTVLREAVQRVQRMLRPYDALGRFGGEEFLVVLPDCDRVETESAAERIRGSIGGRPIEGLAGGGAVQATVSIGGIVADRSRCSEMALLAAADAALYRAKHQGRNRVVFADPLNCA